MAAETAKLPRRYWVVSQNVNSIPRIVDDWEKVIRSAKVAVMGHGTGNKGKRSKELGYKFAHQIKRGNIMLVARGTRVRRELVGCGAAVSFAPTMQFPGGPKRSVRTLTGQKIGTAAYVRIFTMPGGIF